MVKLFLKRGISLYKFSYLIFTKRELRKFIGKVLQGERAKKDAGSPRAHGADWRPTSGNNNIVTTAQTHMNTLPAEDYIDTISFLNLPSSFLSYFKVP